ncbi:MAG: hypothetical protein K2K39_02735 [Clostridia bacterium]|nr:hypothetical protein [Clostridia bacterium]
MIVKAEKLFNLSAKESEELAASAGISLTESDESDKSLYKLVANHYNGTIRELCYQIAVDERAFRYYKYKTPPKNVLLAVCTVLGFNACRTDSVLREFGYCMSASILTDSVVAFYLRKNTYQNGAKPLNEINAALYEMGVPALIKTSKK